MNPPHQEYPPSGMYEESSLFNNQTTTTPPSNYVKTKFNNGDSSFSPGKMFSNNGPPAIVNVTSSTTITTDNPINATGDTNSSPHYVTQVIPAGNNPGSNSSSSPNASPNITDSTTVNVTSSTGASPTTAVPSSSGKLQSPINALGDFVFQGLGGLALMKVCQTNIFSDLLAGVKSTLGGVFSSTAPSSSLAAPFINHLAGNGAYSAQTTLALADVAIRSFTKAKATSSRGDELSGISAEQMMMVRAFAIDVVAAVEDHLSLESSEDINPVALIAKVEEAVVGGAGTDAIMKIMLEEAPFMSNDTESRARFQRMLEAKFQQHFSSV